MSLTADLAENNKRVIGGSVDPSQLDRALENEDDLVEMTCGACGAHQRASGRALGYTCDTCGSVWRVLRCRGCRKASVVLDGTIACPRCGHEHQTPQQREVEAHQPSWLTEPEPLSVWLGGVKYLGGHAERDQPVKAAGLLLDRRGIHLRAFAELFSIRWDGVRGVDIEGPQDISERLSMTHLMQAGASTWALQVAYLTVRTSDGDAIFEVEGLSPPALHARLSRVIQGLQRSKRLQAPIAIDRPGADAPRRTDWVEPPAAAAPPPPPPAPPRVATAERLAPTARATTPPSTAPRASSTPPAATTAPAAASPATTTKPSPLAIDVTSTETPLEVLVIDSLWKLAQLREVGLLDAAEVQTLRARLLARLPELTEIDLTGEGPLLHV